MRSLSSSRRDMTALQHLNSAQRSAGRRVDGEILSNMQGRLETRGDRLMDTETDKGTTGWTDGCMDRYNGRSSPPKWIPRYFPLHYAILSEQSLLKL